MFLTSPISCNAHCFTQNGLERNGTNHLDWRGEQMEQAAHSFSCWSQAPVHGHGPAGELGSAGKETAVQKGGGNAITVREGLGNSRNAVR